MDAHGLTLALSGRWCGSYGLCQCVCHDDGRTPALKITDDDRKDDGIDLHCFAGCDWRDVKAALQLRGMLPEFSGLAASPNHSSGAPSWPRPARQPIPPRTRPE